MYVLEREIAFEKMVFKCSESAVCLGPRVLELLGDGETKCSRFYFPAFASVTLE